MSNAHDNSVDTPKMSCLAMIARFSETSPIFIFLEADLMGNVYCPERLG